MKTIFTARYGWALVLMAALALTGCARADAEAQPSSEQLRKEKAAVEFCGADKAPVWLDKVTVECVPIKGMV